LKVRGKLLESPWKPFLKTPCKPLDAPWEPWKQEAKFEVLLALATVR